jgi:hypothetical protein
MAFCNSSGLSLLFFWGVTPVTHWHGDIFWKNGELSCITVKGWKLPVASSALYLQLLWMKYQACVSWLTLPITVCPFWSPKVMAVSSFHVHCTHFTSFYCTFLIVILVTESFLSFSLTLFPCLWKLRRKVNKWVTNPSCDPRFLS